MLNNNILYKSIYYQVITLNFCEMRYRKRLLPCCIPMQDRYDVTWERLPFSSWATGLMFSGAYATWIFMAGLIFTSTFAQARDKSRTLGANVIGAVAGGLSQNASFIFGLKALLPMAALCYVGAALFGKEKSA